jgi:steroid delta-isomerase-like uncharacterized protein
MTRAFTLAIRMGTLALALTAGALWWSNRNHSAVAEGTSAVETNKEVLRGVYQAFNSGDFDALDQLIAADMVNHNPTPGQPPGIEGVKAQFAIFKAGFPEMQVTIEQLLAEGDMVADRIVARGTNTGAFLGLPPTGKQVQIEAIETYRMANGKIVEAWHVEDIFGLLTQLGVIPPPGQ